MNFRDLQYFITLADVTNFKTAADLCFVSQPTLSMQIKKLEEELGVMLFERDKRFVQITTEGEQLLDYAHQILRLKDDMKRTATTLQDPTSGTLNIGMFPTLSPFLLPKVINKIGKTLPNMTFNIQEEPTDTCIAQLQKGLLDVIFIASEVKDDKLDSMPLFKEVFYLACPKHHPLSQQTVLKGPDIPENELLLLNEGHCLRDQGIEYCRRIGKQHNTSFSATSLSTVIAMVALGKGISLVPSLARSITHHQAVTLMEFQSKPPSRTVIMYWRKSLNRHALLTQLGHIIQQCLKTTNGITLIEKNK